MNNLLMILIKALPGLRSPRKAQRAKILTELKSLKIKLQTAANQAKTELKFFCPINSSMLVAVRILRLKFKEFTVKLRPVNFDDSKMLVVISWL